MADELVLHTRPQSRGRIARWMLEEVGEPYRVELLADGASLKSPGFLAINPMGKVPALTHGAVVVTETAAICAYLADAFPGAGLAPPPGSPARASYYRWLFFGAGPVETAIVNTALGFVVPQGKERMVGYGSLAAVLDALEGAVSGGGHVAGDRFSAADVYLGSQVAFGLALGTITGRPALAAYAGRVQDRPAAVRARAAEDAAMKAG